MEIEENTENKESDDNSVSAIINSSDKMQSILPNSQKHRDFILEPMGEKEVTAVAGIGPVLGSRLSEKGFDKAYVLLGN